MGHTKSYDTNGHKVWDAVHHHAFKCLIILLTTLTDSGVVISDIRESTQAKTDSSSGCFGSIGIQITSVNGVPLYLVGKSILLCKLCQGSKRFSDFSMCLLAYASQ